MCTSGSEKKKVPLVQAKGRAPSRVQKKTTASSAKLLKSILKKVCFIVVDDSKFSCLSDMIEKFSKEEEDVEEVPKLATSEVYGCRCKDKKKTEEVTVIPLKVGGKENKGHEVDVPQGTLSIRERMKCTMNKVQTTTWSVVERMKNAMKAYHKEDNDAFAVGERLSAKAEKTYNVGIQEPINMEWFHAMNKA
jgi:hypothetical protein